MKEMKTRLRLLVAYQTRPGRWWALPFFLVQGGLGLVNTVGEYRVPLGWTYLAVALIYLLQMMWPSVLGWWGAMVAWFAAQFVAPLHDPVCVRHPRLHHHFFIALGLGAARAALVDSRSHSSRVCREIEYSFKPTRVYLPALGELPQLLLFPNLGLVGLSSRFAMYSYF